MSADTDKVTSDIAATLRRQQAAVKGGVIVMGTVLVAAVIVLSIFVVSLSNRIVASCDVWRAVAGSAITIPAGVKRPSEEAIRIIESSREAFTKQECPGDIPDPDPSLLHWERYYHLPVR